MAYLYVILSHTNTAMGRVIRSCTGCGYNHVSLTLNEDLSGIVSFARIHIDAPLYGGYVAEPLERFLYSGNAVPVQIYRLEITEAKARQLEKLFAMTGPHNNGLVYNYLASLTTVFRLSCPVPGAYTCLSFASAVIGKPYRSLQALQQDLAPYAIFHGDLRDIHPDSGCRGDIYFEKMGFLRGTLNSGKQFARLLIRIFHLRKYNDPVAMLKK